MSRAASQDAAPADRWWRRSPRRGERYAATMLTSFGARTMTRLTC